MYFRLILTIFLALLFFQGISQKITIQPYLQDAEHSSIYILWETDFGEESIVEWGQTEELNLVSEGISFTSNGTAMVHQVQLKNLDHETKYYYRVKTNDAISAVYHFKTPPHDSDHGSFRIVSMSDMQRDGSFPDKFREIVEDGIINFLDSEFGGDIVDNLALVMIPGDLVGNGNDFGSWQSDFFKPSEKLFSHVPVYPVLGNHENNSTYYFTYFKLPDNGSPGYEEHWWFKDYGNVRIIGLNSNSPFTNEDQLLWLENLLNISCAESQIDFVFAQLHHPHKSELWTPGESDFTGEVISLLEGFSTECEKPSIHFFGHTHGYSRGQSRDHKHLWINVATAGGAIDNWGEFPNFDYDEFSVSQDEYGFVMVEVSNGDDPKIVVKRISRGDQDQIRDNEIRDSLTIKLHEGIVDKPSPIFLTNSGIIAPECVILEASDFSSPNPNAEHGQSHWQVTTLQVGFDNPVVESWKNFENWYFELNTQAEDDLTDEKIIGLSEHTEYFWRVRYRDKELNWSEWSDPTSFSTGASISLPNLLLNPGAEENTDQWNVEEGIFESLDAGVCNGILPHSGDKYFSVGGLCEHSEFARVSQLIDLTEFSDSIDTGEFAINFGGYMSNYSGADLPEMKLIFLNEGEDIINETQVLSTLNSVWTYKEMSTQIPEGTRMVRLELKGTRNAGTDNDSYFDDLFLNVGTSELDCNDHSNSGSGQVYLKKLMVYPVPAKNTVSIQVPDIIQDKYYVSLIDSSGMKWNIPHHRNKNNIELNISNLVSGEYIAWIRATDNIFLAKIIVVK